MIDVNLMELLLANLPLVLLNFSKCLYNGSMYSSQNCTKYSFDAHLEKKCLRCKLQNA